MKYVALLRGINVGGNKMVKMEKLRETFAGLGLENVKTYINSGNIVFETAKTNDVKLAEKIRGGIEKDFGFDVSVMIRSMDEIGEIVKNNPFDAQFENDKDLHVFFLDDELSVGKRAMLLEKSNDAELIAVSGRTVYYLLRISIIDSILGKGFIDRKLKIPATARNWRTVKKIADM